MISVGIVSHESRRPEATSLSLQVGADLVHEDDGTLGCTGNHLATMQYLKELSQDTTKSDWLVLMEDDAIPVPNFRAEASRALQRAPGPLVSFYLGRGKPWQWQEPISRVIASRSSWLMATHLLHAVGYAIRISQVDSAIKSVMAQPGIAIDEALSEWAIANNHMVAYTKPSLLNHRDTLPTTISDDKRKSKNYLYVDTSPGLKQGFRRIAWQFGTRNWDSTQTTISTPVMKTK